MIQGKKSDVYIIKSLFVSYNITDTFIVQKKIHYIFALMLLALLAVACSSEKAIKKGDQYAAVLEYGDAGSAWDGESRNRNYIAWTAF